MGCPPADANSPDIADDDWSCVLITSSGLVIHDAIVPATPPEKRLFFYYKKKVIVYDVLFIYEKSLLVV